jgi:quercetin dioxygenase-like cupin family protein
MTRPITVAGGCGGPGCATVASAARSGPRSSPQAVTATSWRSGPNRAALLLRGADIGGRFSLTAWVTKPPPTPGPPIRPHADADETAYPPKGGLVVIADGAEHGLTPGDLADVPRNMPHGLANP